MTMHPVAQQIHTIVDEMDTQFINRREVVVLTWLTVLAGEHMFVLGEPGIAKTMVADKVFDRVAGAKRFEILMAKSRSDSAILGAPDLPLLREHGEYKRKDKGFITDCDLCIIDEIGKMSPTSGHEILAVLNERVKFEVNGKLSKVPIDLSTAVTLSNELPAKQSEDAEALWDRLLVRVEIKDDLDASDFARLLTEDLQPTGNSTVDWSDLKDVIKNVVPTVTVEQGATDAIVGLRKTLHEAGLRFSPRRWRASMKLLRAAAFYDGRDTVTEDDVPMLQYVLWDEPKDIPRVTQEVLKIGNPAIEKINEAKSVLASMRKQIADVRGGARRDKTDLAVKVSSKFKLITADLLALEQEMQQSGRSTAALEPVFKEFEAINMLAYTELMDIPEAQVPISALAKAHNEGVTA